MEQLILSLFIVYCFLLTSAFSTSRKKQGHNDLHYWTTQASPHCCSAYLIGDKEESEFSARTYIRS